MVKAHASRMHLFLCLSIFFTALSGTLLAEKATVLGRLEQIKLDLKKERSNARGSFAGNIALATAATALPFLGWIAVPETYSSTHKDRLYLHRINARYRDVKKAVKTLQQAIRSIEYDKIKGGTLKSFLAGLGVSGKEAMPTVKFLVRENAEGMSGLFSDLHPTHLFYSELQLRMNDLLHQKCRQGCD